MIQKRRLVGGFGWDVVSGQRVSAAGEGGFSSSRFSWARFITCMVAYVAILAGMTTPPALSRRQTILGQFIRDVVFGTNDALLTNIGIITGFTASLVSNRLIVLAVLVDIFTSAFAMATGTYLSRTSEDDYFAASLTKRTKSGVDKALANPYIASVVMWVVYVIAGFIPLLPFFFGLPPKDAAKVTVVLGALTFLVVGIFKGKVTNTSAVKSAVQFFVLGTLAALIGYGIGAYASTLGIR